MLGNVKKYWLLMLFFTLLIALFFIFYLDSRASHRELTFAMLDVGQGDALFIESPTGTQILVDGGPPKKVLGELAKVMPPFDRTIDAIIITNPDADHIAGFLDVLKVYKVGAVFETGTFNDSKIYRSLEAEIQKQNIPNVLAKKGMKLHLGAGATIDILFPDRDVSLWTTNDGSMMAKLIIGENSIMLTGDATSATEKLVLSGNSKEILDSDILKVGHHGSHTSSSQSFVEAVSPKYALISDGKENSYGHPHAETLQTLQSLGVKILRTDELGTIVIKYDGQKMNFSSLK